MENPQNMGIILVFLKINTYKNIFFSDDLGHLKLAFKIRFWHFSMSIHMIHILSSFEHVDCWLKINIQWSGGHISWDKSIFSPFMSLCRTAWQPYRLSQINALCINFPINPRTNPWIFPKNIENWRVEKLCFCESAIFIFFFSKKFFLLHPHENQIEITHAN